MRSPLVSRFSRLRTMVSYMVEHEGVPGTESFRSFLKINDKRASFFHDVPLNTPDHPRGVYNMIVEIPRWSTAKMEINKAEPFNPIKQDIKKGVLRHIKSVFPYHGYIWNYGALPQTWESPKHTDKHTGLIGDNDPIDVIEIGCEVLASGSVVPVKVLGAMALLDEGETDWKILAIKSSDPLAERLNGTIGFILLSIIDVSDVEREIPGLIEHTRKWFREYKIPDGKGLNEFAFAGEAKNREFALEVIGCTHKLWKDLIESKNAEGIALDRNEDSRVVFDEKSCEHATMHALNPHDKVYYI